MIKPQAQDTKAHQSSLKIIFLTVFLNIVGFSIMLPLFPSMMEYYLNTEAGNQSTLLANFVNYLEQIAAALGRDNPALTTSVLFGCALASIYSLLQFIFAATWGKFSDRKGRSRVLRFTLLGTAISSLIWMLSTSFEAFLFARILAGIMAGSLAVASAVVADITTRENRSKGMAVTGIAFGLGFLFGPAIGGITAQFDLATMLPFASGYLTPFSTPAALALILGVINYLWVSRKLPETLPAEKRLSKEQVAAQSSMWKQFALEPGRIRTTNAAYFLFILIFSGLEFTLPFLAAERLHFSPAQIGYLFLYIGFILLFAQGMIVRKLVPVIGERLMAAIGLIFGCLSYWITSGAETVGMVYLGVGFLPLSIGLIMPSLSGLVSLYSDEANQGKDLGLFRSAGSLARAFGPISAAAAYFYFGSKETYLFAAVAMILPIFLIARLPNPKKGQANAPAKNHA